MPDTPQQQRRSAMGVAAAVVVVALAVVAAVWLTREAGDDPDTAPSSSLAPGGGGDVLPRAMGGQEAIDALGDRLDDVAELNGMSVDELRDLLLRDASVEVAPSGRLRYDDDLTPPPTPR